jgi:hypothetical protein
VVSPLSKAVRKSSADRVIERTLQDGEERGAVIVADPLGVL